MPDSKRPHVDPEEKKAVSISNKQQTRFVKMAIEICFDAK